MKIEVLDIWMPARMEWVICCRFHVINHQFDSTKTSKTYIPNIKSAQTIRVVLQWCLCDRHIIVNHRESTINAFVQMKHTNNTHIDTHDPFRLTLHTSIMWIIFVYAWNRFPCMLLFASVSTKNWLRNGNNKYSWIECWFKWAHLYPYINNSNNDVSMYVCLRIQECNQFNTE